MAIPSKGDSQGIKLLVLVVLFLAFAILAVGLRLWARRIKRFPLRWNDYSVFLALLFTIGLATTQIIGVVSGGIGQHLENAGMPAALIGLKVSLVEWLLQAFANTFVRLSFLHLLASIFSNQRFQRLVHIFTALTIFYMVGCFISFFALCRPFAYNWNPTIPGGHCGNQYLPYLLSAIFNFCLDFSILILPMPMLWGLQMATSKKQALTVVFGMGIVVCVATILRTVAVVQFRTQAAHANFTYTVINDALWSSLEPSLGVINACMPVLPPVAQKVSNLSFSSVFSWSRNSTKGSKTSLGYRSKDSGVSSSEDRNFERIGDETYPLTPLKIAPPKSGVFEQPYLGPGSEQNSLRIQVRQDWDVRASSK